MAASPRPYSRGWALASAIPAVLVLALAAWARSPAPARTAPPSPGSAATAVPPVAVVPAADQGLAAEVGGYRLESAVAELPAGRPVGYPFSVTGPDGRTVTDFADVQTKKVHFYAIRSDLTGYQHLHPAMAPDGGWTADLAALDPGSWRLYAAFTPATGPRKGRETVLSRTVTVPGAAATAPLPAAAGSATADGHTVALQVAPAAGGSHRITATVSADGRPVTDLQPYLDSYAHLSAFHEGDQALAHLHPMNPVTGNGGGPVLTFHAMLGSPGNWRLFLQFQTGGQVHTAALTIRIP
ncbi:hypothetical protein [Kitasatospora sp. NPDC051914]|uniref:hypothetical protein n=1 Tax=Kitasatospora sp. NPDC051914 TaxID=3154945 RepID=UPI00342D6B3F